MLSSQLARRLGFLKVALVPAFIVGLWLIATVIGAPLGLLTVGVAWVMWHDANRLLRGSEVTSRRLAILCEGVGILAAACLAVAVVLGLDDLFDNPANIASFLLAVAWIVVVLQAGVSAVGRTSRA